jgi:hypothetical protein
MRLILLRIPKSVAAQAAPAGTKRLLGAAGAAPLKTLPHLGFWPPATLCDQIDPEELNNGPSKALEK